MRYLLKQRLAAGATDTYIDATSLTPRERRQWIRLAESNDCDVEALFFDTPLETCLQRNQQRPRVEPGEVIRLMARRMKPPSKAEGFSKITVIR